MRVVYTVTKTATGWSVRRGFTASLHYGTQGDALRAAENLAKAVTAHGDRAAVKLVVDDEVRMTRIYSPEWSPTRSLCKDLSRVAPF